MENALLVLLATFHAYMRLSAVPVMSEAIQTRLLAIVRFAPIALTLDVRMLLAIRLLALLLAVVTFVSHLHKTCVVIALLIDVLVQTAALVGLIHSMAASVFLVRGLYRHRLQNLPQMILHRLELCPLDMAHLMYVIIF